MGPLSQISILRTANVGSNATALYTATTPRSVQNQPHVNGRGTRQRARTKRRRGGRSTSQPKHFLSGLFRWGQRRGIDIHQRDLSGIDQNTLAHIERFYRKASDMELAIIGEFVDGGTICRSFDEGDMRGDVPLTMVAEFFDRYPDGLRFEMPAVQALIEAYGFAPHIATLFVFEINYVIAKMRDGEIVGDEATESFDYGHVIESLSTQKTRFGMLDRLYSAFGTTDRNILIRHLPFLLEKIEGLGKRYKDLAVKVREAHSRLRFDDIQARHRQRAISLGNDNFNFVDTREVDVSSQYAIHIADTPYAIVLDHPERTQVVYRYIQLESASHAERIFSSGMSALGPWLGNVDEVLEEWEKRKDAGLTAADEISLSSGNDLVERTYQEKGFYVAPSRSIMINTSPAGSEGKTYSVRESSGVYLFRMEIPEELLMDGSIWEAQLVVPIFVAPEWITDVYDFGTNPRDGNVAYYSNPNEALLLSRRD